MALAGGDFDFWVNSWYPNHYNFLSGQLADGSLVSDHTTVVGEEMYAGGLQGFMVDIATAEANGIATLADIGDNPDIAALWLDVLARHDRGDPVLTYTWTPSAYITQLVPGQDVIWVSVPNPLQDQRGAAALPADQCPGQPCEMGFTAADILVSANNDFLAANPAAATLLEQVKIGVLDVALQNVRMDGGENSQADIVRHAQEWVETNRDTVDAWLQAARTAG